MSESNLKVMEKAIETGQADLQQYLINIVSLNHIEILNIPQAGGRLKNTTNSCRVSLEKNVDAAICLLSKHPSEHTNSGISHCLM